MALTFKQYTLTATATRLSSILGLTVGAGERFRNVDFKAKSTNAGKVYIGPSTVTNTPTNAGVELGAGEGWATSVGGGDWLATADEVYVVGTAADIVFIATER